jgi:hypothetical protein
MQRYMLASGWLQPKPVPPLGAHVVDAQDPDGETLTVAGYTPDGGVVCLTRYRDVVTIDPLVLERLH